MTTVAPSPPNAGPSRLFLVLGFLATTAVTTAATVGSGYYLNVWQVTRSQKIADVGKFVDATEAFNPLVRDYTTVLIAGKTLDKPKEALAKNLQLQDSLLENLGPYLDAKGAEDVRNYRRQIVAIDGALSASTTVLDSKPLYQSIADSLLPRRAVIGDLRRSAGLPGASPPAPKN